MARRLKARSWAVLLLLCLLLPSAATAQGVEATRTSDAEVAAAVQELASERERAARMRFLGAALAAALLASALYFAAWAFIRQRSERASRENEARLRAIMSTVADAIVTIDESGAIVSVNAAAERLFGRSEDDLVGHDVSLLMPEPDGSLHAGYVRKYIETGEARIIGRGRELIARRADGAAVPVELRVGEFRRGDRRYFTATLRDLTERRRTEADLKRSERRLADIASNFPGVIYQCALSPDGMFSYRYLSEAYEASGEASGPATEAPIEAHARRIAVEDREHWIAALRRSAETLSTFEIEHRVATPQGVRWIRSLGRPHREPDGVVVWNGVDLDVTDRKRAEEHQALLMAELDHRVKNTLATVQAIAAQTLPPSDALQAFVGRLAALAHTHSLLARSSWEGARLADIVEEELAPFRGGESGRVSLQGEDVLLDPKAAQALALAVHELTTNAAKFGALSVPGGRLAISWRPEGAGAARRLVLDWVERDGPRVEPPATRGFGSLLIERSLSYELNGEVRLDYRPEGVRCRIEVPLGGRTRRFAILPAGLAARAAEPGQLAGARVLVVEDVHLVAMELEQMLREAGCEVVGPAPRLQSALSLARSEALDAAVLDINLAGEAVYPVADTLKARGVPFVFATGYDVGAGGRAPHPGAPRLSKPVDRGRLLAALREALGEAQGRATRQTSP